MMAAFRHCDDESKQCWGNALWKFVCKVIFPERTGFWRKKLLFDCEMLIFPLTFGRITLKYAYNFAKLKGACK
jgi:hypothetical protein